MTADASMQASGQAAADYDRAGQLMAQLRDRLNQTPAAHIQGAENILQAVERQLFADESLSIEGQLLWALTHAVVALAYELGVPAAPPRAASPQSASPLPSPRGTAG